jgi:hypothetical protein
LKINKEKVYQIFGQMLAISGAAVSIAATIINNVFLLHVLAMQVWGISNPLMFVYFIGLYFKKWDGGVSTLAMIVMYGLYIVTNNYGLSIA